MAKFRKRTLKGHIALSVEFRQMDKLTNQGKKRLVNARNRARALSYGAHQIWGRDMLHDPFFVQGHAPTGTFADGVRNIAPTFGVRVEMRRTRHLGRDGMWVLSIPDPVADEARRRLLLLNVGDRMWVSPAVAFDACRKRVRTSLDVYFYVVRSQCFSGVDMRQIERLTPNM